MVQQAMGVLHLINKRVGPCYLVAICRHLIEHEPELILKIDLAFLWILLFLAFWVIIEWILGQTDQKVGAEQTFTIHHFFEDALQ